MYKRKAQAEDPARLIVSMRGTGADKSVLVMKLL